MSLPMRPIIYLMVITLSSCIPLIAREDRESFIQNKEEFIPTNEWQEVKEGQAIPPGLHVRLNLQTGQREAKLLENNKETKTTSNDIIPILKDDQQQQRISKQKLQRAFANLDLSKDDIPTDEKHNNEVKAKFRPYDELRKDFESINMKIETDQEILKNLVHQLSKTNDERDQKRILTDLEYYLHQYDNAISFSDMNGLELLIKLLNTTDTTSDIRYLTSLTLGAAFQGNPKVQLKALNLNVVQCLLRLLNTETDNNLRYRLLFTLSSLLRNFPQAQKEFIEHGGIETIVRIFEHSNSDNKLKLRAIELMSDLITEKDQNNASKPQVYENVDIQNQLVKRNWCSYISDHLTTMDLNDFNQIEKILMAMIPLTDVCHADFISLVPILDKLNDVYARNNLNEDSIYKDILINIHILRKALQQISSSDL